MYLSKPALSVGFMMSWPLDCAWVIYREITCYFKKPWLPATEINILPTCINFFYDIWWLAFTSHHFLRPLPGHLPKKLLVVSASPSRNNLPFASAAAGTCQPAWAEIQVGNRGWKLPVWRRPNQAGDQINACSGDGQALRIVVVGEQRTHLVLPWLYARARPWVTHPPVVACWLVRGPCAAWHEDLSSGSANNSTNQDKASH